MHQMFGSMHHVSLLHCPPTICSPGLRRVSSSRWSFWSRCSRTHSTPGAVSATSSHARCGVWNLGGNDLFPHGVLNPRSPHLPNTTLLLPARLATFPPHFHTLPTSAATTLVHHAAAQLHLGDGPGRLPDGHQAAGRSHVQAQDEESAQGERKAHMGTNIGCTASFNCAAGPSNGRPRILPTQPTAQPITQPTPQLTPQPTPRRSWAPSTRCSS